MDNKNFKIQTHNGTITVINPATGGHRTFKIKTQPENDDFFPGGRIVYRLFGDHSDWVSIGVVMANGIKLWKKFRGSKKHQFYAKMLFHPEQFPTLQWEREGACRVCNRPLTNPESIETGIGPVCRKRVGA
jgi:hypothetical protein